MHRALSRLPEKAILLLLAFTILFRGGKSLESTWLLIGVASLCTLLYHWQTKNREEEKEKHRDIRLAIYLLIMWTGASYVFSQTQNYGLDEVLRTGGLGLLLLWYMEAGSERLQNRFFVWLRNLTIASCLIGLLVYALQPVNRFVGTFFDMRFHTDYWPNAAAEFLLLAWPITLITAGKVSEGLKKFSVRELSKWIAPFLPTGLALGCLFLTFSRGALIAFVGQIALLTIVLVARKATGKTLHRPLTHIAVSLGIGFLLFTATNEIRSTFHSVESVREKMTFTADEGFSSIEERSSFWKQAKLLSLQRPFLGWGPYSFRFVQPRLQKTVLATSDHPHNLFLKYTAERGIMAAIFLLTILLSVFVASIRLVLKGRRLKEDDHARLGDALLFAGVAGVFAHNLIDYNLQFVGIALPLWLTMGILLRRAPEGKQSSLFPWFTQKREHTVRIIIAMVLLIIACREGIYLLSSSAGRSAEARGASTEALGWYEVSQDEWFTRDLRLSQAHLLLIEGKSDEAQDAIEKYLRRNAEDARAWKLKGETHMLHDEYADAIAAYERAFKLASWNDLSISRGLLEALFAQTYMQPTSNAAADSKRLPLHPRIAEIAPLIEKRALAFTAAIESNLHFVALSPNAEEAIKVFITLSVLHPEKTEKYRNARAMIEEKMREERGKISARTPGWLW